MQFDYLSLTEENKKKWKQSLVITVTIAVLSYSGIFIEIARYLKKNISVNKFIAYYVTLLLLLPILLRIVLSTI